MTCSDAGSPFVIRAPQARAFRDARTIVAEAHAEADRMRAEIEAERHVVLAQARVEGLGTAAREAAPLLMSTAAAVARFWTEREAELHDLVLSVAHRVLTQLPPDEVVARIAADAIAEHARDSQLALRVSPELLEPLRAALADQDGERVTIVSDPALAPGHCALLHARGRTELGLLAQFRAMMTGSQVAGGAA